MQEKPILLIPLAIASLAAMGHPVHRWQGPEELSDTPIVSGTITTNVGLLILLPVLFMTLKERQVKRGTLRASHDNNGQGMVKCA